MLQRAGAVRCADGARRLPERRALREPGGRIYEQREYVYKALNEIPGITAVKPKAAFYIFPKMDVERFNITDDEQFALDLLHEKRILITRGGGFNWNKPDHFRIVYCPAWRCCARRSPTWPTSSPTTARHRAACRLPVGPLPLTREMAPLAERRRAEAWCLVEFVARRSLRGNMP